MVKIKAKTIVLCAVAVIVLGLLVASNVVLTLFKPELMRVFSGGATKEVDSEVRDSVLELGDNIVEEMIGDSATLLKNENDCLPLAKGTKVNLFGWNSTDAGFVQTGGGSGGVNTPADLKVTLTKAFDNAGVEYNKTLTQKYVDFNSSFDADNSGGHNQGAEALLLNPGADFYDEATMKQAREYSDTAIIVISRYQKENGYSYYSTVEQNKWSADKRWDPDTTDYDRHYLETSAEEDAMISAVCDTFSDGNVIVLLNLCNVMECGFIDEPDIDAAMFVGVTGKSGANAIPDLLFGDITPSGRTADTYAYEMESAPSFANATFVNSYNSNTSRGITDEMRPFMDHNHYMESIYVGYKWYETAYADKAVINANGKTFDYSSEAGYDKIVQYPFGYGLSYTTFDLEIVKAPEPGATIEELSEFEVQVRVTNTGDMPGKEVVQLYYTPPYTKGGIEKSAMNLLAFGKTVELLPASMTEDGIAESQILTLKFDAYDMAAYDDYDKNDNGFTGYELEPGDYTLRLMSNAHEAADVEGGNTVTLNVPGEDAFDSIQYILDPDTDELVENRFTGDTAYADMPTDGSTVHDDIEYMTRENFADTFPAERQAAPNDTRAVDEANEYEYTVRGASEPTYDADNELYLVTRADGSPPSSADLSGDADNELVYNEQLLRTLVGNDRAPEWERLLNQVSLSETRNLVRQGGFQTAPVPSIGLPRVGDMDGPTGFSTIYTSEYANITIAFPSPSTLAYSFSPQITYSMGRMQGVVARETEYGGWYAPTVNIHRSPFCSRNFESYSEDPVLTGKMAAELIRGAKHNGLRCYLKHFALDEAGDNPKNWKTWANEQTIREIYLKPFEICVKEGGANSIMSSFNCLGAVWAGGNRALLTDILRTEWGFKGNVITDYNQSGYMHISQGLPAGNDMWLSGNNNSIDMNDVNISHSARLAVRHIVYNFADTYVAAKDFAEFGDPDDPYRVDVDKVTVTQAPYSPLLVFLWVLLDVILVLGVLACVFFAFFFDKIKARKRAADSGAR